MMFHRTCIKCEQHPITIGNNSLTASRNTKLLGVIIDNKLNWSDLGYVYGIIYIYI